MTDVTDNIPLSTPFPRLATYIGKCGCREWIIPYGYRQHRCELCGVAPRYERHFQP